MEILLGIRPHPVMQMYREWLRTSRGRKSVVSRGNTWADTEFKIPIHPGDSSLLDARISHLSRILQDRLPTEVKGTHFELAFEPGSVLLRLIVLRVYLRRPSTSDGEILDLVLAKRIHLVATEWQEAAQAYLLGGDDVPASESRAALRSIGVGLDSTDSKDKPDGSTNSPDDRDGALTATNISDQFMDLERHISRRIVPSDILEGSVEVRTTAEQPYVWTGSTVNELSGGPPFSSFRPRPQPIAKSAQKRKRDSEIAENSEDDRRSESQVR